MKRTLFLLGLSLLLTLPAATAQKVTDFSYQRDGDAITITGYTGKETYVFVPQSIDGLPVTRIGERALAFNTNIVYLVILNSVTNIGDWAFRECANLAEVQISSSVADIGQGAFYGCTNLLSVDLPGKAASIGDWTFAACARLSNITIPNTVTNLGNNAFYDCGSLTNLIVPSGVTAIGDFNPPGAAFASASYVGRDIPAAGVCGAAGACPHTGRDNCSTSSSVSTSAVPDSDLRNPLRDPAQISCFKPDSSYGTPASQPRTLTLRSIAAPRPTPTPPSVGRPIPVIRSSYPPNATRRAVKCRTLPPYEVLAAPFLRRNPPRHHPGHPPGPGTHHPRPRPRLPP